MDRRGAPRGRRRGAAALLLWAAIALGAAAPAEAPPPLHDLLIRGGRVVDGTGNPWFHADVAIRSGRIAAIGSLPDARARRVLDVRGMVVCPGFIDVLGHSGRRLLQDGRALSKLTQGITTEVMGEGGSVAPRDPQDADPRWAELPRWRTLDQYFRILERRGTAINVASRVGAGTVRSLVLGDERRAPTPSEMERMRRLVGEAMRDGALGLSSALEYAPGAYASARELIDLARVAGRYGGYYATHLRDEGRGLEGSLEEALRVGREARVPVSIFHLKVATRRRWGSMPSILRRIEEARREGLDVTADVYPYVAAGTGLSTCLPPWAHEGDRLLERLRDPAERRRIREEIASEETDWENLYQEAGAEGILLASLPSPGSARFLGKTLAQATDMMRPGALGDRVTAEIETLLDLVLANEGRGDALYFLMSEEDVRAAIRADWTAFCTDAGAMGEPDPKEHPRAFGTFPRILGHYVREEGLLSLEQAVRKMTSLPARGVGLTDRGLLRPGLAADVVVFDPAEVRDRSTFRESGRLSEGIRHVVVNGHLALLDGRPTGALPGRALRGRAYQPRRAAPRGRTGSQGRSDARGRMTCRPLATSRTS